MLAQAREIQGQLSQWRRTIHRHPELGFEVHGTAELVARALMGMGIEVQTGVGKTGVVGYLGAGKGPTIAIRADMDALPIQEENDVDYASQLPGCMHACGHDAHTAMLLGAAALLSRQHLPGQVRFIFQPSEEAADEEGISGAPRMIDDGALEGVDAIIALHVDGELETGRVCVGDGWVGAAVDTFKAYVKGQGGHGAFPHQAVDPIWLTTQVLSALYALPSRRVAPLQPSVVSVGVIRGGSADNVIPDSVYLEGTLRSFDGQVREQLVQEVERALMVARAFGGDYHLEVERGYPPTYNDPQVVAWLRRVGGDLLGKDRVCTEQKSMGAEDFSYMAKMAKGAMLRLGVRPPQANLRYLHTSTFDLDEQALPIGAAVLAETARRFVHGELF
ncbi:MAG: M20 family metallopeptidase [Anaerolineae bacterium]